MNQLHPFLQVVWIVCASLGTIATFVQLYHCQRYFTQMLCIFIAGVLCSFLFLFFTDQEKLFGYSHILSNAYDIAIDTKKLEGIFNPPPPVDETPMQDIRPRRIFNWVAGLFGNYSV
jgi:hypothetical protein